MAIAPLPEWWELESDYPELGEDARGRPSLQLVEVPVRRDQAVVRFPTVQRPASVSAGRRARRVSARVRRRRLVFALVAVAAVAGLATAAGPATGHGAPSNAQVAGGTAYVVQSGDTLWSIATRFDKGGDPRPLAEAIAKETGSTVVVPGERIVVP